MRKPQFRLLVLLLGLLLTIGLGSIAYLKKNIDENFSFESDLTVEDQQHAIEINVKTLRILKWSEISRITQSIDTRLKTAKKIIQLSADMKNPATIYLRGFMMMVSNKPLKALKTFNQLYLNDIPVPFLYPAYRLQSHMQPDYPNRYLKALFKEIDANRVSPLIAARVEALERNAHASLLNYLKTDPSKWGNFDVSCIQKINMHAGLTSEVRRMVAGAIHSGRISEKIITALRLAMSPNQNPALIRTFKQKLKRELVQGSVKNDIALLSAKHLLETRKLFLKRSYQKIVDRYKNAKPMALADESVLFLLLSSVEIKDRVEIDRWAQEIKRRYPDQEVINWIFELTNSAR